MLSIGTYHLQAPHVITSPPLAVNQVVVIATSTTPGATPHALLLLVKDSIQLLGLENKQSFISKGKLYLNHAMYWRVCLSKCRHISYMITTMLP